MADLVVELYGTRVGVLSGTWRTFDFVPDPAAVARFGIDSTVLSVAIPLTAVTIRSRKARRQIFFRELLPESTDYPTAIYDEEYGARFARAVGLASFTTWIEEFEGVPAVVIERYDRSPNAPQGRIHQEDFNQVLGATGNQKYQKYGGRVSLARIAQVFTTVGDRNSLERLFKLVVVAVAVGNLDMHAKNVSLLHHPDGSMTLSPAYDIQPQAHLPNDGEVALAVGGEYRHASLTTDHLIAEGSAWGLRDARGLAEDTLTTVLRVATTESPHERAHTGLAQDIAEFASNLLAGRAAGNE